MQVVAPHIFVTTFLKSASPQDRVFNQETSCSKDQHEEEYLLEIYLMENFFLIAGGKMYLLKEINTHNLGMQDKADFFSCEAAVMFIPHDRAIYQSCPNQDCKKKVRPTQSYFKYSRIIILFLCYGARKERNRNIRRKRVGRFSRRKNNYPQFHVTVLRIILYCRS